MKIICSCGCGKQLEQRDNYGRIRKYIHGHNNFGKKHSEHTKKNLSLKRIGAGNPMFGKKWSDNKKEQHRILMIENNPMKNPQVAKLNGSKKKGRKYSESHRRNLSIAHKNYKPTIETRRKLSNTLKGSGSTFWRGGLTEKNQLIRTSLEYALWREVVLKRDNYICIECNSKNNLQADHIKPFALYPELRFELSNGRTLCKECHKKTPTYGRKTLMMRFEMEKQQKLLSLQII